MAIYNDVINRVTSILYISVEKLILIIAILISTIVIQKIVKKLIEKGVTRASRKLKVDETKYKFFKHFISAIIYVCGIGVAIYMIPSLRTLSVSLFAGAGIIAVIVGFASQQAFSNIVSGLFLTIFKPFRVGDRIRIGNDIRGLVEDINLRHTVIKDFENKRIVIPNAVISSDVIVNSSLSDEKECKFVEIGISYDSDINKALKIMEREALKHPLHIDNRNKEEKDRNDPIIKTKVIGFGDSSVNLRAWVWAKNTIDGFNMLCDLNKSIKESFDKEGIEIPFPYRTIVYKNDISKSSNKNNKKGKKKTTKN